MDSQSKEVEDPLIAALPPNTDYITYLTLLEYQLTPKNLSTLNRLLSDDDGTLASEIGWDLPKMVLPMLQVIPEEANQCFEIIARRGNPREVIVRVAEEFERLGQSASEGESDDEQDDLPTFAGEATRIHLGEMKLDGMPEEQSQVVQKSAEEAKKDHRPSISRDAESGSDDGLSFKALINMLGILHPRIKTQHPSRFLATSLPAALGAYRRLPINEETTTLLLNLLGKLSGKQRPALPPRTSTTGSLSSLRVGSTIGASTAAPLPDPESKQEQITSTQAGLDNEKAIIQRLLQAVLLEIVDDYSSSLLVYDITDMQWTSRLREKLEPKKVVPGRTTIVENWDGEVELKGRDGIMDRVLRSARDLSLDLSKAIVETLDVKPLAGASTKEEDDDDNEAATDYPQSPSDIPFPISGLLILQAAQQFYSNSEIQPAPLSTALGALAERDSIGSAHSAVITDAMLSIVYMSTSTTSQEETQLSVPQDEIAQALKTLTSIFTSDSNAFNRDNAHHVAKSIVHNIADIQTKTQYLKSLLKTSVSNDNAITSVQSGNIKAIAVTWLKDEFLASTSSRTEYRHSLDPGMLSTDQDLIALLLPSLPSLPGPFISSHPPAPIASGQGQAAVDMSSEADLESFLRQIPFYIASLNLITILSSISDSHLHSHSAASVPPTSNSGDSPSNSTASNAVADNEDEHISVLITTPTLLSRAKTFIQVLQGWQTGLTALLGAKKNGPEDAPLQMTDLYSLEDALGRAETSISSLE